MFRRTGTGSFPNAGSSEIDDIFNQVCGQDVVNKLIPRRKSLMSPKSFRVKPSASPRRQKKFRKKMYYEELDLDLSPGGSEEDGISVDDLIILDYDDPDLEAPVFWAANDKLVDGQLENKLRKRLEKAERAERQQMIMTNSSISKDSLPAVSELLCEVEGCNSTDSPSSDESEPVRSKSSRKKHNRGSKKAWRNSEIDDESRVVLALRDLVLQQQKTLFKMANKNKEYRERLASCQARVLTLKKEHLDQKDIILNLELDKESLEAENIWLREELETIRNGLVNYQKREQKYEEAIIELRGEQSFAREKHEAILVEARQARADLCAIAGNNYVSREASIPSAVEASKKIELQNEIAELRLLISNLRRENKKANMIDAMPDWLDLSGAIHGSIGTGAASEARELTATLESGEHALCVENLNGVENALSSGQGSVARDLQEERVPEWLDLIDSSEHESIAGLTSPSEENLSENEESTRTHGDMKINMAPMENMIPMEQSQHKTRKVSQEGRNCVPEARDPGSPIPVDIEHRSQTEEEDTVKVVTETRSNQDDQATRNQCITLSSSFSVDGGKARAEEESQITLDLYSEISSFLSDSKSKVCTEKASRAKAAAAHLADPGVENISLDDFFKREKRNSYPIGQV